MTPYFASLAGAEGRQFPSLSPVGNVLYAVPVDTGTLVIAADTTVDVVEGMSVMEGAVKNGISGIEGRGSQDRKPPPPSAASAAVDAEDPKRARRAGRPFFPTAYMPPAPRAPRRGVR